MIRLARDKHFPLKHNVFKLFLLTPSMVKGKVVQFRRGRRNIHEKHFLIEIDGVSSREDADKYVGKAVSWKSPAGKIIKGKVASAHGNNGVLRCIFERGLPGQAITTEVSVN